MPGRTGKRAKEKRPCGRCSERIEGPVFYRTKKADYCPPCYEDHVIKETRT
jgi:hypothetical protein